MSKSNIIPGRNCSVVVSVISNSYEIKECVRSKGSSSGVPYVCKGSVGPVCCPCLRLHIRGPYPVSILLVCLCVKNWDHARRTIPP